ncbi:MAG: DUF21 domain-containing protein, partial [Dehalococcoidia bacterium]|nr:DUF21 domain-containing protein [Dehalococcoidia bacterium]
MLNTELLYLALFLMCLVLSAFFCSSETAFFSVQRFKLEHLASTRAKGARHVASLL